MIIIVLVIFLYFFIGSLITAIEQRANNKNVFDLNDDSDIASSVIIWPVIVLFCIRTLIFHLAPYIFVRTILNIYTAIKIWIEVFIGIIKRAFEKL